nr:hypothetical protein [Lentilactobacillus otakiensis]
MRLLAHSSVYDAFNGPKKTYEVKIYPDVAKVNGASLSFIAHPEGVKQKMVFYARLRDKGQQRQVVDGDQHQG